MLTTHGQYGKPASYYNMALKENRNKTGICFLHDLFITISACIRTVTHSHTRH